MRNYQELAAVFGLHRPELVIHLAGIADVRACEANREEAWETNVTGTENVVLLCQEDGAHPMLLYPSTPCVFECERGGYTESSSPQPINYYGQTKLAAETLVLGYDNALVFRKNFVPRARWKYPGAFTDRYGTYLFADELAFIISQLPQAGIRGVVHLAGSERLSMFELAKITTPEVGRITMDEVDLELCVDMSLSSERLQTFPLTKSPNRPADYNAYKLTRVS